MGRFYVKLDFRGNYGPPLPRRGQLRAVRDSLTWSLPDHPRAYMNSETIETVYNTV